MGLPWLRGRGFRLKWRPILKWGECISHLIWEKEQSNGPGNRRAPSFGWIVPGNGKTSGSRGELAMRQSGQNGEFLERSNEIAVVTTGNTNPIHAGACIDWYLGRTGTFDREFLFGLSFDDNVKTKRGVGKTSKGQPGIKRKHSFSSPGRPSIDQGFLGRNSHLFLAI